MARTHVPVLAGELIAALDPAPGAVAVDCTFGAGGHARLIADRIGPGGEIVCIDRDPQAAEHFAGFAAEAPCATRFIQGDYADVLPELIEEGLTADLVYLDLGISSMQVDARERGFSYAYDAPLDMRMDPSSGFDARTVVNEWPEARLVSIFRQYGEERYARGIAHDRARGRHQARRPGPCTVRRGASRAAGVPGDPDRGQRRARLARAGAAGRLGAAAPRRSHGGDLVPLARGQDGEALLRRPRARLHLPARPAGVRLWA
jgi:hypothetical protein